MHKLQLPKVSKNSLMLFYFVEEVVKPEDIGFKIFNDFITPILSKPDNTHIKNFNQLWKKKQYGKNKDFLPKIKKLFSDDNNLINSYILKKNVIEVINKNSGISAELSNKAVDRLSDIKSEFYIPDKETNDKGRYVISYHFNEVLLHTFQTDFSVIMIKLSAKNPNNTALHSSTILEAFDDTLFNSNNGIRFNNEQCVNVNVVNSKGKNPNTSFADLAYGLVGLITTDRHKRTYTHAFVEFNENIEQEKMAQYSIKLAKHYNEDYHIVNCEDDNIESVKHFENVVHHYSREGSSTVVVCENDDGFLEGYLNNVIKTVHMPIHLLIFHLERALNVYATSTIGWIDMNAEIPVKKLRELEYNQSILRNFDINFIHNVISTLSRHNLIYQKLSKVKSIREQYQKITQNSQTVSKIIEKQEEKKEEIKLAIKEQEAVEYRFKYCKLTKWGVGAITFLTVTEITREFLEIILHYVVSKDGATYVVLEHNSLLIHFAFSMFFGIFSMIKIHQNCSKQINNKHGHSMKEHVEHALHRKFRFQKYRG